MSVPRHGQKAWQSTQQVVIVRAGGKIEEQRRLAATDGEAET